MICYKDKTFCNFYKECKIGKNCARAFTDIVEEKAKIWSKTYTPDEMLVCFFVDKPDCFIKID